MCGLGGIYCRDGLTEDHVHAVIEMAKRSVDRGKDATGFMNHRSWWKVPQESPRAVERSGFGDWLEHAMVWNGHWLMFHTRRKSQGSEFYNENNHPLIQRHVWVMHNGRVYTPDYFGSNVVDTRNLGYLIDWSIDQGLDLLQAVRAANMSFNGRASLIISKGYEFVITRNDDEKNKSPLRYLWNKETDSLQFGSTKTIVGKSVIGKIGRKQSNHKVVAYDLQPHQALWYNGNGHNIRRIWHDETHGGDGYLVRRRQPRSISIYREPQLDLDAYEELGFYE